MPFGYNISSNWLFLFIVQLSLFVGLIKCESRFVTLPESQTVIEGDSIIFSCHATPITGLQYSWTHNGHSIKNSSRVHQVGSNLHLNNIIKDTDFGDYVCIATTISSGARQASPPARLNIIWLKSVYVQLQSSSKDEIILKCHVEGSLADLDIEWFHNSEKLAEKHDIHFEKNHLIIRNPSIYDNGQYRCIAANKAGRVMSKKGYNLKWPISATNSSGCITRSQYKNKFLKNSDKSKVILCRGKRGDKSQRGGDISILQHPKKTKIKEGEHFELHCKFQLPMRFKNITVFLKWFKDGKEFRQTDLSVEKHDHATEFNMESMLQKESRVTVSRSNGSLLFTTAASNDAGLYQCQIIADGHSPVISESAELKIIESLRFLPQPTSTKNLELGSVGKIHCKAQGSPTPHIKWIKEKQAELPETVEDINGTLIFRNVTTENSGNYTCIASNTQGQINATVSVGVVVAPKFLIAPKGPIHASEMGLVNFHCQAIGDPLPTVRWDKDSTPLNENNTDWSRFELYENGTLQIREVHLEDEGQYGCTIGSSAGFKREEVRFIVRASELFTTEESSDGFMITKAVLITMSVAFAYIVLVVGLMLWCRYRRRMRKARLNSTDKDNIEGGGEGDIQMKNGEIEPCLPVDKPNTNGRLGNKLKKINGNNNPTRSSGNETQKSDETISSKGSKKSNALDQLSVPRSSLSDLVQIGRGEFGEVFVGKIKSCVVKIPEINEKERDDRASPINENSRRRSRTASMDNIEEITEEETSEIENEYKQVLVKALNKIKDENACQEFKRQIEMFKVISHKGVAKLFGLCRDKDPHYLILEYTDWGDLKQFLLATAGKINTNTAGGGLLPPLKRDQILALGYQIARGMDSIYRARFIHKDLATRNCVLRSDFVVKVSYPALCKDKYSREYFKHRNQLLPIRWLSPECIQDDDYTTKSDIFAFGVLVWELFNQATKLPFEELTNEEYLQKSNSGSLTWECEDSTPEDLKEILSSCWKPNPKDRPSFSHLCAAFSKSMQSSDK